jgi:hypothetical protein
MRNSLKIVKSLVPNGQIKRKLWDFYTRILIKYMPYKYGSLEKKIRKLERIKIAFFIQQASNWKYDLLFNYLLKDNRFEPLIVICPVTSYDSVSMHNWMKMAIDFFRIKGYPYVSTWNEQTQKWLDIKGSIRPDIVFFSNPWPALSRPEYYIFNFLDTLTCYVPYSFRSSHLHQAHYNKPFQNLLWKIFYETEIHKRLAFKYAYNKGFNGIVSGYPGMDDLLDGSYIPNTTVWKSTSEIFKRIIWAPHHTIFGESDSNLGYSTFLLYSELFLNIANKYENCLQISFKPHPLLKTKLYDHPEWGKVKTDSYYEKWSSLPNTQLDEGNYVDLFLTSDGLIHDSGSFIVEYLYTKKPVMFLLADENVTQRFNEVGNLAFNQLYHGRNEIDINNFIDNVIFNGYDIKKEGRISFFELLVKPPKNRLASENIYNFLKDVTS